jgi:hypothetical protein
MLATLIDRCTPSFTTSYWIARFLGYFPITERRGSGLAIRIREPGNASG